MGCCEHVAKLENMSDEAIPQEAAPTPGLRAELRELFPGFQVPLLSLGGAPLGGIAAGEASSILRVAADAGIALVDTSSAYGASEGVIGDAPVELSVTTKFGNPCALNGHTHDYSAAHCVQALYNSFEALRGKPIAALQLHSPPEHPSPLVPALVDLLESLQAAGKFGAWGASVHTVNGGMVALNAGAGMLQVPYNLLYLTTWYLTSCTLPPAGTLQSAAAGDQPTAGDVRGAARGDADTIEPRPGLAHRAGGDGGAAAAVYAAPRAAPRHSARLDGLIPLPPTASD